MSTSLDGILADTWWYAMTARLTDEDLQHLAKLRVKQGFTAAQLVVGIPPESTPDDSNAASPFGPAWTLDGRFNDQYLAYARNRIQFLNHMGLRIIVYGAWGPQITWLGVEKMTAWWTEVLKHTADLDVVYCLTGESNLQVGLKDLAWVNRNPKLLKQIENLTSRSPLSRRVMNRLFHSKISSRNRRHAWSQVLEKVSSLTDKPFLIHPNPNERGIDCVENPHLLAANTAQTGHTYQSRPLFHQLPLSHMAAHDPFGRGFINLEPWYEGIHDQFFGADQLYAYWVGMLAGAIGFCYGAQGIWNVGDGNFLSHWGGQTFSQALVLDTPRLLGLSHQLYNPYIKLPAEVNLVEENSRLISIQRKFEKLSITFIPESREVHELPMGDIWLPMSGYFTDNLPASGQVVIFSYF